MARQAWELTREMFLSEAEVDRLAGLCQQHQPGSISESFRQVLSQAGQVSTSDSFVEERAARATISKRRPRSRMA